MSNLPPVLDEEVNFVVPQFDIEEYFCFSYTYRDDSGAMRHAEINCTYKDGSSLMDEGGPIDLFNQFLTAAGYLNRVEVVRDWEDAYVTAI